MAYNKETLIDMLSGNQGVDLLDISRALIEAENTNDLLTSQRDSSIIEAKKHQEALEQVFQERSNLQEALNKAQAKIAALKAKVAKALEDNAEED